MKTYRLIAFTVIAVLYLAIPNARPDFTRFNCNDSECYLALSWNLARGRGYTRSMVPDLYIPHTTWPPGTSVLLLPATALSGPTINWLAVKWTMCIVGLSGIVAVWFFVKRVSAQPRLADLASLLIGLNPIYWDFSHQAMAELPLTVWVLGGLYLVDRIWAGRQVCWYESAAAGFLCGLGMLFKGHAAGLALVPLAYLWGARRTTSTLRTGLAIYVVFAVCFTMPQLAWTARKHFVPASGFEGINHFRSVLAVNPNDADSPLVTAEEFRARLTDNVRLYAIYRVPQQMIPGCWPDSLWDWPRSGYLALLVTVGLVALAWPRSPGAWPACLAALPPFLLNLVYAFGGSPRFWLPVAILLMLAIICNCSATLVKLLDHRRWLAAITLLLFANLTVYLVDHEKHPYRRTEPWQELAELFETVAKLPAEHPEAVLTTNPDAFQLMTGHPAPWGKDDLIYDFAVLDTRHQRLPLGARVAVEVSPWVFVALERPGTAADIRKAVEHPADSPRD